MHVNQLAKALKTTPDTVRYYTRIGLLRPSKDASNAYKCYGEADLKRLRFILCARQMGFAVDEIAHLLKHSERGEAPCPEAVDILQRRMDEMQQRLKETRSLEQRLGKALRSWHSDPRQAPTGHMLSELIDSFVDG